MIATDRFNLAIRELQAAELREDLNTVAAILQNVRDVLACKCWLQYQSERLLHDVVECRQQWTEYERSVGNHVYLRKYPTFAEFIETELRYRQALRALEQHHV
jgi:hypothetical protein